MHDVACEFAREVTMRSSNGRERKSDTVLSMTLKKNYTVVYPSVSERWHHTAKSILLLYRNKIPLSPFVLVTAVTLTLLLYNSIQASLAHS